MIGIMPVAEFMEVLGIEAPQTFSDSKTEGSTEETAICFDETAVEKMEDGSIVIHLNGNCF